MASESIHMRLTFRLLIFFLAASATGYTLHAESWMLAIPLIIITIIIFFNLVYQFNSTNRKIAWFFDSVANEDTTLHYPENIPSDSVRLLHKSLNRLNEHIADIKLQNEHNEKFFQELLKSSATGLLAVNENGYIEHINDAALELIGMQHIAHMDLLRQKSAELAAHMESIKPGQSHTIKVLHNNELRLYSLKMALLHFGASHYKLYSISDIHAELEENELDSWQKLIRVMTHEIMNSIAPITSLSNTLSRIFIRNNQPLPAEEVTDKHINNIIEGLGVIENTGKGLMRFVEDYRKLTKIPIPIFKPLDVNAWISSNLLLMKDRFESENIKIKVIRDEYPVEFPADEKLLNQVLINILNNAVEALDHTIDKEINISLGRNNARRLKISISDNGKGIAPEDTDKIFIPFYTTREEGSGIGLSLCRKIMRLHKGTISVTSSPGRLTTFVLNF